MVQERLFRLKRECVRLRRAVMPLRQGLDLLQEQPALAAPALAPYYRDVVDHVIRTVELVDNIRDLLTSMLEVRVAQVANHLNEVMKKLTAWAGIILVPTLIAGIYGMNFENMPELRWQVGYPLALGLMAASAAALYVDVQGAEDGSEMCRAVKVLCVAEDPASLASPEGGRRLGGVGAHARRHAGARRAGSGRPSNVPT